MLSALAVYLGSKLLEKKATDDALKKQRRLDAERKQKLSEIANKRRARTVGSAAEVFDPGKREAATVAEQNLRRGRMNEVLAPAIADAVSADATTQDVPQGTMSDELAFRAATAQKRAEAGSNLADIMSRLSAVDANDLTTKLKMADTALRSGLDVDRSKRISDRYDARINAVKPNSTAMILSALGQTYGMGSMIGDVAGGGTADVGGGNIPLGPRSYGYNMPIDPMPRPYSVPFIR